ncbi:hypothetical protein [Streptomyces sp. NPDC040750]|uniref:hypothetical protein n=1 Tax=Streptomyces sp. NPDC040750 TaxID=3154491 RepID=UPI0033F77640
MRETPDAGRKRIDLNVPQVAGGAMAAVVAAKLASYFGVYGTILGAGVVSVVATCGGTVFQHFFRRTGEQLREKATVAARPRGQEAPPPGEFTRGTVHRARVRGWKRPVLAAAVVFGVTMAGITTCELASGSSFSGGGGTTVSGAVTGRGASSSKSESPGPGSPDPGSSPKSGSPGPGSPGPDDGTPSIPPSGTPDGPRSGTGGVAGDSAPATPGGSGGADGTGPSEGPSPSTTPTPGGPAGTPTAPGPSASSRSGTPVPGRGDPAAP